MATLYYISESAYTEIVQRAVAGNYVKPGLSVPRGLSPFINDLSACELTDSRPEDIQELDPIRLRYKKLGYWTIEEYRMPRALELTMLAQGRFLLHALNLGLVTTDPHIHGGPRRASLTSATAAVLEAIGIGWIAVSEWPTLSHLPHQKQEFAHRRRQDRSARY